MRAMDFRSENDDGLVYMERYRSGHNGPDSKSGSPHGLVGSNPTRSAMSERVLLVPIFDCIKNHSPVPLFLLFRKKSHCACAVRLSMRSRCSGLPPTFRGIFAGFWIFLFFAYSKNQLVLGCSFYDFGKNGCSILPPQIALPRAEKHRFDVRLKPMPAQGFRFQYRCVNKAKCICFHCKLVDVVVDSGKL